MSHVISNACITIVRLGNRTGAEEIRGSSSRDRCMICQTVALWSGILWGYSLIALFQVIHYPRSTPYTIYQTITHHSVDTYGTSIGVRTGRRGPSPSPVPSIYVLLKTSAILNYILDQLILGRRKRKSMRGRSKV